MLRFTLALLVGSAALGWTAGPAPLHAQLPHDDHEAAAHGHDMWTANLGGGWMLTGMAHIYPVVTAAAPFTSHTPLRRTDFDLPHAAAMGNLTSPGQRFVVRLMPNFEGLTLPGGEVALGTWGEGFIDSRHPHTLLHEGMLSFNWWGAPGGAASFSAGRGFAPYGTDDPMYRPALKYPTNHHIAQILERWTASAAYLLDAGWGAELGIFAGAEPEDPWDMGNFEDFPNSWSGRLSRWFGGVGPAAPWELSISYGRVRESAADVADLYNASIRHSSTYGFGDLYSLVALSRSDPRGSDGYFSILGETQMSFETLRPFVRLEYATRPEYAREADAGRGFFRYAHHDPPIGATRWLISSFGGEFDLTDLPLSLRPFVEANHHRVRHERGPETSPGSVAPEDLFGTSSLWTVSVGARLFLGGGPMRMGHYGVLDPMTTGPLDLHPPSPQDHEQH